MVQGKYEIPQDELEEVNQVWFIEELNEYMRPSSSEDSSGKLLTSSRSEDVLKSLEELILEHKPLSSSIQV